MGAKNTANKSVTYLKLKAKTSETDLTPVFAKQEKEDGHYVITETFNSVDGYLKEITSETYEYEGETKHKCKMKFADKGGEITFVESNFNNLLYGILNSFLGAPMGFVEIQVWLSKERDNGKRYASAAVKNNGQKTEWKFKIDELPKPQKVGEVKGKAIYDDSNVIEFWVEKIKEIQIEESSYIPETVIDIVAKTGESQVTNTPETTDDLPF